MLEPSVAKVLSCAQAVIACIALTMTACDRTRDDADRGPARPSIDLGKQPVTAGSRCIVHLHGKGGRGAKSSSAAGIEHLYPEGNRKEWGGLEWRYFPDANYQDVRAIVTEAIATGRCERVIIHGFSNGASFAAKLACRGETFAKRLVGVIVDDPVPDHAVEGCRPADGLKIAIYSTGTLTHATDGWACKAQDYTCEGGSTIGLVRYAQALGAAVQASPQRTHLEHPSPPEYVSWW